jgi:hypothetical protein
MGQTAFFVQCPVNTIKDQRDEKGVSPYLS